MIHGTINMSFEKKKLLEILRKNRDQHAAKTQEASETYRAALLTILRSKISQLEANRTPSARIDLPSPFHYLDNYDEVIEMLEMTSDDYVNLTAEQFKRYAKDEWPQKQLFDELKSSYDSHLA